MGNDECLSLVGGSLLHQVISDYRLSLRFPGVCVMAVESLLRGYGGSLEQTTQTKCHYYKIMTICVN